MTLVNEEWKISSFCESNACVEVSWRTSSRRQIENGCVQPAQVDEVMLVRDSKNPDGPVLTFTRDEWDAFVAGVRAGEFD